MQNFPKNLNIELNSDVQLIALSDVHEHPYQFFQVKYMYPPSDTVKYVNCGDLIDKGHGYEAFSKIVSKIMEDDDYVIKGNHELKRIKKAKKNGSMDKYLEWLDKKPLIYSFVYPNGKRYTFVHGGITPKMTWENINNNVDLCYTRAIGKEGNSVSTFFDGKKWVFKEENVINWHEMYDGRFGYVISGHQPLEDGKPKFYKNSCNIDTACFITGTLTGLIINQNGVEHFQVHGK